MCVCTKFSTSVNFYSHDIILCQLKALFFDLKDVCFFFFFATLYVYHEYYFTIEAQGNSLDFRITALWGIISVPQLG